MEHHLQKCFRQAKQLKRDDPFCQLPDEIIAFNILSRFTLEEGARYSILSHRWKKLWASTISSKLIFAPEHLQSTHLNIKERPRNGMDDRDDQAEAIHYLSPESIIENRINRSRLCYESWISNVLGAYVMPTLDELTIRFPFDLRNCDSIDRWIECALKKGVTRLELDLMIHFSHLAYNFPRIEKLQGMLANCGGLYNLRDVYLKHVRVSGDVIEFMIARFPLERLCITHSLIGKLNVSGVSVRLKSLELDWCYVHLMISTSSLTSLTNTWPVHGSQDLSYVPLLSELSIAGRFCSTFLATGFLREGYVSRLKRLEFVMSAEDVRASVNYPLEIAITLDLEELKVEIHGEHDNACFLWPVLLIKAAPFLQKFSMKLECHQLVIRGPQPYGEHYIPLRNAAKRVRHHRYLKTVELHCHCACPLVAELVRDLLDVSDVLEQIVVSPSIRRWPYIFASPLSPSSKAKLIIL